MADLANINALFATRKNQFEKTIYQREWFENPYSTLFPKKEYDMSLGKTPEVVTNTYELPTVLPVPSAMGSISISSGTGNGCDVTETVIKSGYTSRTYELKTAAFETEVICLSDMQFEYEAAQQIRNKERGLAQYSVRWWTMWYQAQLIGMIDTKLTTDGTATFDEDSNSNYTFTGLNTPDEELSWDHLNYLYDRMIRAGANEFAVGQSQGQPVFSLNLGTGYKRKLWQGDEKVRDTVNWGEAFQNFKARGIDKALYGYIPNVDLYAIRYDGSGVYIPPFLNADATKGRKNVPNPAYKTVANGGNAETEVVTVTCSNIFEAHVRPVGPTSVGMQRFNPKDYSGEVRWINNPDNANNKLGDKGYYHMDIQVAAKPVYPELGFTILTKAKD